MVLNWLPELGMLRYANPLPPHTSTIQATLVYIKDMEFHKFVQAINVEAKNTMVEGYNEPTTTNALVEDEAVDPVFRMN
jgi:hypothetical protein